ncbi:MAG: histidinol dehydrogenase [Promethearchaeota archaeon]
MRLINSDVVSEETIAKLIPRTTTRLEEIRDDVLDIINNIKTNGDNSIIHYTKKFDNVELKPSDILVSKNEFKEAYDIVNESLVEAIRTAKKNLLKFHKAQRREDWYIKIQEGVSAGQIYRPLATVGIYAPGGRAVYPSTVLMAATPASVAGVDEIILCSPPQSNGKISPAILVAASEFGIEKVYKVGGAQAIAAMAYGTKTIPAVQKIVGPGRNWVNVCKQLVSNVVAIDTPAGPSEILIIADDSANPNYLMMDLISQVEHDPDNIGIIVSHSMNLIDTIQKKISSFVENTSRKDIIYSALMRNSLLIKTSDMGDSLRISNIIAPEHLQIMTKDPHILIKDIKNAGAVFIGPYTPVPLGDYSAGTNHILPTGGNAKKYSGLNTFDFLKIIDVLECDKEGLRRLSTSAMILAEFEGFFAHKEAIEERLKEE